MSEAFIKSPQYQQCQAIFDRAYPNFQNAGQVYAAWVSAAVTNQSTLLDLGCGRDSLAAEGIQQARRSMGIDLVREDLQHNRTVQQTALANAYHLPFSADQFDVISCQWVVEHFDRPALAWAEIQRVLRPNGRFIFMTTNAYHYVPLVSYAIAGRLRERVLHRLLRRPAGESFPTFYRANSRRALTHLAAKTGLILEKLEFIGNPFYLAFNVPLFRLGMLYEKITDGAALKPLKLYMVAQMQKG